MILEIRSAAILSASRKDACSTSDVEFRPPTYLVGYLALVLPAESSADDPNCQNTGNALTPQILKKDLTRGSVRSPTDQPAPNPYSGCFISSIIVTSV